MGIIGVWKSLTTGTGKRLLCEFGRFSPAATLQRTRLLGICVRVRLVSSGQENFENGEPVGKLPSSLLLILPLPGVSTFLRVLCIIQNWGV